MSKRGRKAGEAAAEKKTAKVDEGETAAVGNVEAFVERLSRASGPELHVYIRKALNAPDLFNFGEVSVSNQSRRPPLTDEQILDVPAVASLEKSKDEDERRLHSVLHLLAYDTYSTYRSNRAVYGDLSVIQERKLRQLSIVSLCARHKKIYYDDLKEELGIHDVRELEDMLMDTIYSDLIGGKLDSKNQVFSVDFAISRDIRMEDLHNVQRVLVAWQERADGVRKVIGEQVDHARGMLQQDAMKRGELDRRIAETTANIEKLRVKHGNDEDDGLGGGGGGGGGPGFGPEGGRGVWGRGPGAPVGGVGRGRRGGPGRKRGASSRGHDESE